MEKLEEIRLTSIKITSVTDKQSYRHGTGMLWGDIKSILLEESLVLRWMDIDIDEDRRYMYVL